MNPTRNKLAMEYLAESRRLAAASVTCVMFAIAALPWAYVAVMYEQKLIAGLLVLVATILGHIAFMQARASSFQADQAFEAEALDARRSLPKL